MGQPFHIPLAQDLARYRSADSFHPSDAGYRDWFGLIEKELEAFGL